MPTGSKKNRGDKHEGKMLLKGKGKRRREKYRR